MNYNEKHQKNAHNFHFNHELNAQIGQTIDLDSALDYDDADVLAESDVCKQRYERNCFQLAFLSCTICMMCAIKQFLALMQIWGRGDGDGNPIINRVSNGEK